MQPAMLTVMKNRGERPTVGPIQHDTEPHTGIKEEVPREALTDDELVVEFRAAMTLDPLRAQAALQQLYERQIPKLRRSLASLPDHTMIEDIIQQTCLQLLEYLHRPEHHIEHVGPWLNATAKMLVKDMIRSRERHRARERLWGEPHSQPRSPDSRVEQQESESLVHRAIASIPYYWYRLPLFLQEVREYTPEEVAPWVGLTDGQTRLLLDIGNMYLKENIRVQKFLSTTPGSTVERLRLISELYPARLRTAIQAVPHEQQRRMLIETYIHHRTPAQIAQQCDMRQDMVRQELSDARQTLLRLLQLEPVRRTEERLRVIDKFKEKAYDRVVEAIRRIPSSKYRRSVWAAEIEGKSYGEISAVEKVPVKTVTSRLHDGRSVLLKLLTEENNKKRPERR